MTPCVHQTTFPNCDCYQKLRAVISHQSEERWEWSEEKTKEVRELAEAEIRQLNLMIKTLQQENRLLKAMLPPETLSTDK